MIIEFNGLPGTGKTTVAKKLGQKLSEKGIINEVYTIVPPITKKEIIFRIISGGWKILFYALNFAKSGIVEGNRERKKVALVALAYYNLFFNHEKKHNEKILICDQGIFQALVSIAHIDEIKDTEFARKVIETVKKFDVYFVCCEINSQLSETRLKLRKNGGSRFDKMSEEERHKNLLKQQSNFETLRDCLEETVDWKKIIKINTIKEPDINAQVIFDSVMKNEGKT